MAGQPEVVVTPRLSTSYLLVHGSHSSREALVQFNGSYVFIWQKNVKLPCANYIKTSIYVICLWVYFTQIATIHFECPKENADFFTWISISKECMDFPSTELRLLYKPVGLFFAKKYVTTISFNSGIFIIDFECP